jgi:hypothetical protein
MAGRAFGFNPPYGLRGDDEQMPVICPTGQILLFRWIGG